MMNWGPWLYILVVHTTLKSKKGWQLWFNQACHIYIYKEKQKDYINRILVHTEHLNMQIQQDSPSCAQENLQVQLKKGGQV